MYDFGFVSNMGVCDGIIEVPPVLPSEDPPLKRPTLVAGLLASHPQKMSFIIEMED